MKSVHWPLMGELLHLAAARPGPSSLYVTSHPSTASVSITVLLYNGPLLCSFNVAIKPGTHTGDKVEFNMVEVDRVALAPYTLVTKSTVSATKSTELATLSTATSCRIQVVADLSPKLATKSTVYGDSRLCCRFVAGFGNNRLCRQCVPGYKGLTIIWICNDESMKSRNGEEIFPTRRLHPDKI